MRPLNRAPAIPSAVPAATVIQTLTEDDGAVSRPDVVPRAIRTPSS